MKDHYKILIRTSWVVLICCSLIKIFGGNYFEIAVQNEKFISICNYVDNNLWLKKILAAIMYMVSTYTYLCIALKEKHIKLKHSLLLMPLMFTKTFLGWYYPIVAFILDIFILFIIPVIINKKLKWNIISFILLNVFQLISLLTKNFSIDNFNNNLFLVQTIYQIDFYIMLILYYLYTFKKKEAF